MALTQTAEDPGRKWLQLSSSLLFSFFQLNKQINIICTHKNEEQQRVPPARVTTLSSRQVVQVENDPQKCDPSWWDLIAVLGASQKTKKETHPTTNNDSCFKTEGVIVMLAFLKQTNNNEGEKNNNNKTKRMLITALCDQTCKTNTKPGTRGCSEVRGHASAHFRTQRTPPSLTFCSCPQGWRSIHRWSALGSTGQAAAHAAPLPSDSEPQTSAAAEERKKEEKKRKERQHLRHGPARVAFTDKRRAPNTQWIATFVNGGSIIE